MRDRITSIVAVGAAALLLASCAANDRKPVFPVSGKVTFDKKPTHRALVVFHPVGESAPGVIKPRGQVGADGTFTLTTYDTDDGAPAGDYLVTVEWWLASGKPGDDSPPANRLPGRYAKAETSRLRARVEPETNRLEVFELKR